MWQLLLFFFYYYNLSLSVDLVDLAVWFVGMGLPLLVDLCDFGSSWLIKEVLGSSCQNIVEAKISLLDPWSQAENPLSLIISLKFSLFCYMLRLVVFARFCLLYLHPNPLVCKFMLLCAAFVTMLLAFIMICADKNSIGESCGLTPNSNPYLKAKPIQARHMAMPNAF